MAERRIQNSDSYRLKKNASENNKPNYSFHLIEGKKPTSLSSLIVWNVSKAMEKNPNMDIKGAIKAAQEMLADSRNVHAAISNSAEQRHFTCAVLAWQQLGHSHTDSLYHFIEVKIKEQEEEQSRETYSLRSNGIPSPQVDVSTSDSHYSKGVVSANFGSNSVGPVIKLPMETKIVMRAEGRMCKKCQEKPQVPSATKTKIEAACPKKVSCDSRLNGLDKEINQLRERAAMLAKREKDRVELLQRAEQAWKDLERGYQRRLLLAEEKEDDYNKQVKKKIEEGNTCKNSCNFLTIEVQKLKDSNEMQRTALSDLDKQLCELACQKLKQSEDAAKIDRELAEWHCKTSQLDRDVQFKEEQIRRKVHTLQSELESSQTITNETERAIRAELCALKKQVEEVSRQLLAEDAQNSAIKKEIEDLREEKTGMVEDLEGCQQQCDKRMQGQMEDLKKKQEQYSKLNEQVTQCRCKLPVDVVVEAKRTASLAALCHCNPDDRLLKSCSCTSMRSRLMSTLLSDLFSGLQSEMGGAGQLMPCQMLKCLEDRHNWDRASVVKTNLENYFDKLLIGELDIAIATSIENYHAKWVGTSCADRVKQNQKGEDVDWQQRAIERRAQNLAQGLAEQLFEQRAEELEQRAKDIITSGPPPCECTPTRDNENSKPGGKGRDEAAYPVLTSVRLCKLPPHKVTTPPPARRAAEPIPRVTWRSAMQDVTKLKEQIEYLNKESIKKADLKLMEQNITRIMQQSTSVVSEVPAETNDSRIQKDVTVKKELKNKKVTHLVEPDYYINLQKSITQNKSNLKQKTPKPILKQNNENANSFRPYKKLGQNYAINMCMCSQRRAKKKLLNSEVEAEAKNNKKSKIIPAPSSVKQTKPINSILQSQSKSNRNCNGVCFHKAPSNTSIDQLLATLVKWNKDNSSSENEKEFCSLLPGGCPKENAKIKQYENEADTNLETINNIIKRSSPSKNLYEKLEGLRGHSDDNKSLEIKRRQTDDVNTEKSSILTDSQKTSFKKCEGSPSDLCACLDKNPPTKKRSSTNLNNDDHSTIKKSKENRSPQPLLNDDASVLPSTEISQFTTKKQEKSQSPSFNNDLVNKKTISDGMDQNEKNNNVVHNKNIEELPIRDTDVIMPTESKYMGEINLDKSVEEVCECSKCNNLTASAEVLLPCLCKHKKHTTKTVKDQSGDQGTVSGDKLIKMEQKRYDKYSEDKKINIDKVPIGDTHINTDNESIKKQTHNKTKNSSDSYDIKFLGVTLTDVNSQNQGNANKQYIVGEKKGPANNDNDINSEIKSKVPIIMTLETKEEARDQGDSQSCRESTLCDCNLNPDFENTIQTKRGKSNIYDQKCIERVVQSQQTDEDKGLSIQNFEEDQKQDTPCVCCSYKNMDGSEDLEENTFHLLEEHLKDKLQEFKQNSCNDTCIPSEEEEKLFTAILRRVKQVITESTNKITCKCSKKEGTSQGSWNRAYGLLQEYLKTKIKRVQCSCVLAEENNDTILPDVLDKVFHLIEYDFKRLQDVCGCKITLDPHNSRVCFKEEIPERDGDIQKSLNTVIYSDVPKHTPTSITKKENNSFDYEMFSNSVLNLEAQQNEILGKDSKFPNEDKLLGIQQTKPLVDRKKYKSNLPYAGYDCICTNFECSKNGLPDNSNEIVKTVFTKPVYDTTSSGIKTSISNNTNSQVSPSDQVNNDNKLLGTQKTKPLVDKNKHHKSNHSHAASKDRHTGKKTTIPNNANIRGSLSDQVKKSSENVNKETETLEETASKADKIANTESLDDRNAHINSINKIITKCMCCSCTHTGIPPTFSSQPYIGYTIDCSCDAALGPCYCAKSGFRDKRNDMDNIFKKSLNDEKIYREDQYTVQTQSLSDMNGDLFLHNILHSKSSNLKDRKDRETEVSSCEADDLILKDSREYFTKAHIKTNTCNTSHNQFDDIASLATDFSPQSWYGSQMRRGVLQSDQISHTYYNPDDFDYSVDAKNANTASSSDFQGKCSCEMVPICHVKMLVENIENRLVTANCTCDSMIPQVCPKHSMR